MQKSLNLGFDAHLVNKAIISTLIRRHDVEVNILEARVTPNEEGRMSIRMSGTQEQIDQAVNYLVSAGIQVATRPGWVEWREALCVSCGACVAQCLPNALYANLVTHRVSYDQEKCIACLLCIDACPYRAIEEAPL